MEREKEAMEKNETERLELQQKVNRLPAELEEMVTKPQIGTEVLDLRRTVGELTSRLEDKEEQLRKWILR